MTHSFDKGYWDEVWQGRRAGAMSSGQPNPHLVREVGDLSPGTALEAGCGAGVEAIWLAARGWRVTAADIAAEALTRAAERAEASGVAEQVRWVEADLSSWEPEEQYDLVTTHYAHPAIPQLEFYDRTAAWVAPGGTLLVVAHLHRPGATGDHEHGHEHGQGHEQRGWPPAAASVTAAAVTARLAPAEWDVVTAQESPRTLTGDGGREVTLHDVVVRAVRRPRSAVSSGR